MMWDACSRVRGRRTAGREERGASAVEFALLLVPLLLIVFGIFSFGFMLSFRQSLSQAATEGARAAAVQVDVTKRSGDATTAVNAAMSAVKVNGTAVTCSDGRLTCTVAETDCGDTDSETACMRVTVSYPYKANPVVPTVPLLGAAMPTTLTYSATARVS